MIEKKKFYTDNSSYHLIFGFFFIISIASFFLTLPLSSRNLIFTNPIDSIFTATSATCVTGLIVVDTYTHWNLFGHFIILLLIQIGGLSFIAFLTLISQLFKRKISKNEQKILKNSIGLNTQNINISIKKIFLITFFLEVLGSFVLFINFLKDFSLNNSLVKGIFHSISAFCNAGFDLMGEIIPYIGLSKYVSNFTVNLTLIFLIIIGGLGFIVLFDINKNNNFYKLKLQSKLVLIMSNILIFLGTFFILFFEFYNYKTIGNFNKINLKILASLFQSVTTRTAGFNTMSQLFMSPTTKILSIILMFIGGSPGSTAGGIKTVTIFIMILAFLSIFKTNKYINIFNEYIHKKFIIDSIKILIVSLFFVILSTLLISYFDNISTKFALYETISALATVGLSMSLSPSLSFKSKIILTLLMFIGRIGILNFILNIFYNNNEKKVINQEALIIVG